MTNLWTFPRKIELTCKCLHFHLTLKYLQTFHYHSAAGLHLKLFSIFPIAKYCIMDRLRKKLFSHPFPLSYAIMISWTPRITTKYKQLWTLLSNFYQLKCICYYSNVVPVRYLKFTTKMLVFPPKNENINILSVNTLLQIILSLDILTTPKSSKIS